MATSSSKTLDHWRKVFREAGESDVFHVIRQAIRVAASNHPDEFRSRRDKIVEMLFAALPCVEKDDEGRGKPDVEAIEVKAIEEKEDDGRGNAVKATEEKEEESGFGNPVKSDAALFAARTPPLSAEQEPPPAAVAIAVAVVEEKAETKKQETWKVSVSENGKIRLRRVLLDQTKPSKPEITFTENHPAPRNQEGSLPTFTDHHPAPRNQEGSLPIFTDHPEPRNDEEGSLRSNLEAAKRKLREGYHPFEPRPKKLCRRPLQFRISGARLR